MYTSCYHSDPLGVLEEGEIYYKFSKPRKDPKTEMLIHTLQGEVVVCLIFSFSYTMGTHLGFF